VWRSEGEETLPAVRQITLSLVRIDHVVYGVSDLREAVQRFAAEHDLQATGGGEHPEFGTRNEIVPVGEGQYIELMAVADASSRHPLALSLSNHVRERDRPLALCLRPESLDAVARRLEIEIALGERHNPGGEVVRWRLAGLGAALGPERLPFFIDWQGAEERHDREHAEAASADGIAWIEYGGNPNRLREWTGGDEIPLRLVEADPGPHAIGVQRDSESIVIR
jgi:glyoxalase-like protein